jgi:hypothetical protein
MIKQNIINLLLVLIALFGTFVSFVFFPLQIAYRLLSNKYDLCYYLEKIAIALDVVVGAITFGSKHTVSANLGYKCFIEKKLCWLAKFVDLLFGKYHCVAIAVKEGKIDKSLTNGIEKKYKDIDYCKSTK